MYEVYDILAECSTRRERQQTDLLKGRVKLSRELHLPVRRGFLTWRVTRRMDSERMLKLERTKTCKIQERVLTDADFRGVEGMRAGTALKKGRMAEAEKLSTPIRYLSSGVPQLEVQVCPLYSVENPPGSE